MCGQSGKGCTAQRGSQGARCAKLCAFSEPAGQSCRSFYKALVRGTQLNRRVVIDPSSTPPRQSFTGDLDTPSRVISYGQNPHAARTLRPIMPSHSCTQTAPCRCRCDRLGKAKHVSCPRMIALGVGPPLRGDLHHTHGDCVDCCRTFRRSGCNTGGKERQARAGY
jgi:hypothetical protein